MSEGLRDIVAAAKWLGISPKTLQGYVTARSVPFTKVGKHVRFSQAHLDAIVEAGEQPVAQPGSTLRIVGTHPPSGPSTPPPPSGPKLPASLRRVG